MVIVTYDKNYLLDMVNTTKLKQNDATYEIEIPEEYVLKLGWGRDMF